MEVSYFGGYSATSSEFTDDFYSDDLKLFLLAFNSTRMAENVLPHFYGHKAVTAFQRSFDFYSPSSIWLTRVLLGQLNVCALLRIAVTIADATVRRSTVSLERRLLK